MTSISEWRRSMLRNLSTGAVAVLLLSGLSFIARADTSDRGSPVRDAIVAMSIADAAMPAALAVSLRDERPALVPASSAAMPAETASAMAAMKTAAARGGVYGAAYERRVRIRDPFVLMLGIAY